MYSFDLNEFPSDMDFDNILEREQEVINFDGNTHDGMNDLLSFEPFVGQCFLSEEEAYQFYKNYAQNHGFSIRKGRFVTKDGETKRRDFFCHREGHQPLEVAQSSIKQRNTPSSRCGCNAHMRITLRKSFDIFLIEWHVTKFVVEHNHKLLSPSEVCFLPANRNIDQKDQDRILLLKEGGLSIRQIIRVMELEKNVKHGSLPFLSQDISNLFYKVRKSNSNNDAMELLEHCKMAKEENSKFQYAYSIDQERKLEHIFWAHSSCFDWYQKYGDVVVFDTTYKVNSYDMPFGIFVGINNHGKTILFGCALLRNETREAFRWLMKVY